MEGNGETPCGEVPPEEVKRLEEQAALKLSTLCTKCKQNPAVIVYRRDSTCWPCFENNFNKKFKANMNIGRKSKGSSEHVLIAFSGGHSSRALLHAFHEATRDRGTKATFFHASVVHVDHSVAVGASEEERQRKNQQIRDVVSQYNCPLHIVPIEDVFNVSEFPYDQPVAPSSSTDTPTTAANNGNSEKFQRLFKNVTTNTSKEDLLTHMTNILLAHFSRTHGFEKVVVGSSASRLAIKLISETCKGRAYTIPKQLDTLDDTFQSVVFLRPMREYSLKEIVVFNRHKNIAEVVVPTLATKAEPKFSIDHLCENFVNGLQSTFSHTVHTLLRSGSKLTIPEEATTRTPATNNNSNSNSNAHDITYRCSLCSCLLTSEEIAAVQRLANNPNNNNNNSSCTDNNQSCSNGGCGSDSSNSSSSGCCGGESGSCGSKSSTKSKSLVGVVGLHNLVCYGCRRTLSEISDEQTLPPFVNTHANRLVMSSHLRHQIKDFLLDDNE